MSTAVYLLCLRPPYRNGRHPGAGHYVGFVADGDVERRLQQHLAGYGSPLVSAAVAAGSQVTIARVWPGADRRKERAIKNGAHGSRACPYCRCQRRLQPRLPLLSGRETCS